MIRDALRSPLAWILCAAAALRITGLFWGLPAADGWDNDGFAPRNFLTALALTYTPGSYFTYPPLHAFVLAVLTLPGIVIALFGLPSFTQADVVATFTSPALATYFAVVARLVSIGMSLGIIWCVGDMARRLAGARAGLFAAGACALSVVLTYYGQVSNLDVPYLFWASLSLLFVMRAVTEQQRRFLWWAALLAAAAIATKDQAYAVFALTLPLFLLAWFAADPWPRRNARGVVTTLLLAAVSSLFALLLVDGAISNPVGFARRVAFLVGPASQDYAAYANGPAGWLVLLQDVVAFFVKGYGAVPALLALGGVALHLAGTRQDRSVWVAGLLPLLAIISFTLCFNVSAGRTDHRFLMPHAVFACVYIGIAAAWLAFHANRWLATVARLGLVATALLALHHCVAINAAMLMDPRYDAERWMAQHVRPGDTIEIYGQNIFQPRYPAHAKVSRVGSGDLNVRNPLPGVTELREPLTAPRGAKFIVVNGNWMSRYLRVPRPLESGRIYPGVQREAFRDNDARSYFLALDNDRLSYRLVHVAQYKSRFWPATHIHDSLAEPIGIYERLP